MVSSAFNLGEIAAPLRLRYWQDAICETYLTVGCKKLSQDALDGLIQGRPLGTLEVSEVTSPPMAYYRGSEEMRNLQAEYFQLVLAVEGQGIVEQGGRCTPFQPGDMVIYSSSEKSIVTYPQGSTTQVVKIPSALLADRVRSADSIGGTLVDGSTALGSMARSLVRECLNLSLSAQTVDTRICNGTLDILAAAVENSLPVERVNKFTAPLADIKRYIEAHLSDPDLDVHQIAQQNCSSVRTLNRLFAAEGTTANAWIWSRRLAASHKVLSEGKVKRVSQAAYDCGFNDLSHFGRVFKRRYGLLPNEVLRGSR